MIDLTPILNAIIALAAALITGFLIPWIKTKIGTAKLEQVQHWVAIAVQAAEKIYQDELEDVGAKKKLYVEDFLAAKGFKLNLSSADLNALIEAAVYEHTGESAAT